MSVSILMLYTATAGIGFVLMLVIGAIVTIISWITPDALQDWLGKSLTFGKGGRFDGPVAQAMALKALATGG